MLKRARQFAAVPDFSKSLTEGLHAIIFSVHPERYALPAHCVEEVVNINGLVFIPGMPEFVPGFILRKGKVIPIINIKNVFATHQKGLSDLNKVIVVHADRITFGIQAERVEGMERLSDEQKLQGRHHALIMEVYSGNLALLDPDALASILVDNNR